MAKHTRYASLRGIMLSLFILMAIALSFDAHAQNAEIRGTIKDKATGEPLIYTRVVLTGTGMGSTSDLNGIYSISKLKAGTYHVKSTALGYDSFTTTMTVEAGKLYTLNIFLSQVELGLNEIEITGDKSQNETRVELSKIGITPQQIQSLPSVGGEPDLAQYLQILPGVVSTGDQGGQLYIRGGSPVQNEVLMDGMTIYNPFHSIGLFSVFDPDIIRNVDIFTGGFDASYGGRVSAVMDVKTRDGDQSGFGGNISVSPFVSKLEVEGPFSKFTEDKGGSSYLFSVRGSYLEQSAPVFYPYATGGLPYDFLDFYGKMTFNAPGGSKFDIFGFDFNDNVNFPGSSSYGWNSYGAGAKFVLLPPESSTVLEGHFSYSNYASQETDPGQSAPRVSSIGGFQSGLDFTYYPGKDLLKYGVEIDGNQTNFQYTNTVGQPLSQTSFNTELSSYVHYNKVLGRLVIDPSVRMQFYASLNEFSFEPRLGLKYVLTDHLRIKAGGGFYSQNLFAATSDRDVVNLFYGYLTAPDDLQDINGNEVASKIEKAWDVIGGLEADIGKHGTLSVEPYYKYFPELLSVNENKQFPNDPTINEPAILKNDYIIETGTSYGIDFLYKYDLNPFYLWLTYSYSKVTYNDGLQNYPPFWDRTNSANIMIAYRFGTRHSWEASARWAYGSGFPFTQTQGFYEATTFQQGGVNTDYTRTNGTLGVAYGQLDGGRLSDYHRLDLSVTKKFLYAHHRELHIVATVTNAYNRDNVFYFNRDTYARVNQLPIMPSIAFNYKF